MNQTLIAPGKLSTKQLAAILQVNTATINCRLCNTGSVWGLKPKRLENGMLEWPGEAEVKKVLAKIREDYSSGRMTGRPPRIIELEQALKAAQQK